MALQRGGTGMRRALLTAGVGIQNLIGYIGNSDGSVTPGTFTAAVVVNDDVTNGQAIAAGTLTEIRYHSQVALTGVYFFVGLWTTSSNFQIEQKFGPYSISTGMNVFTVSGSAIVVNAHRHLAIYVAAGNTDQVSGLAASNGAKYAGVFSVPNVGDNLSPASPVWTNKKLALTGWG